MFNITFMLNEKCVAMDSNEKIKSFNLFIEETRGTGGTTRQNSTSF